MDDEKIMQIDVPDMDMDMDDANSDLNNILFKSVPQSVDDLAEAIIEQLLVDERLKKIFKQPRNNDQLKERRLLSRQKNKEQRYLLLEDLVTQDNNGLVLSIKADQFAKEYLQVVNILYRELEAEYDDFPIQYHKKNLYLQYIAMDDSLSLRVLMRIEVFMRKRPLNTPYEFIL